MSTRATLVARLGFALAAFVHGGCAAQSAHMAPIERSLNIAARPEAARVIFIRESVDVSGTLVPIISASGALLGELPSSSCFAADIVPGPQRFVTLTRPVSVVDATLLAGHTYFVNVVVRFGTRTPRYRMTPVKARDVDAAAQKLVDCDSLVLTVPEVMKEAPEFLTLASEKVSFDGARLPVLEPGDGKNFARDW